MIVSTFFILDQDSRERFFKESFLLANVKLDIVLEMLFLTINNASINFQIQNLQQRFYIIRDKLLTTRQIELIRKKKFKTAAFDLEYKAFVIHIATFNINLGNKVYLLKKTQTRLFNWSSKFKHQKKDHLIINSKLSLPMFITVDYIKSAITFVNCAKTILLLLGLLSQTKFYLQLFFLRLNQFLLAIA